MLSPKELEAVRDGLKSPGVKIDLVFYAASEKTGFSTELLGVAEQIKGAVGSGVEIAEGSGKEPVGRPCLTLSCSDRSNLHYMARPQGLEGPPFVEALIALAQGRIDGDTELAAQLNGVSRPAELLLFVAPTCTHCPNAVRQASRIARASNAVSVWVVDIHEFPELTERFAVRSVPLTVLDRGFSWTGVVETSKIAGQILLRGTDAHEAAVFGSLVENARLEEAQEQIRRSNGASHFLTVWQRSTTQLRMGLMLVAEEVLDQDPQSLDRIVPDLIETLGAEDASLRGDTADLIGRIGCPSALERLETLQGDPNPDVAEIAAEAIEEIRERDRQ